MQMMKDWRMNKQTENQIPILHHAKSRHDKKYGNQQTIHYFGAQYFSCFSIGDKLNEKIRKKNTFL